MKYLNLTEGFEPYKGHEIQYSYHLFNGGEPHIRIIESVSGENVTVTIRLKTPEDMMKLAVAADALKRANVLTMRLFTGYLPGARQDRVANSGEALTAKVYADMINNMGFRQVMICDPHSDVITALINNVSTLNNRMLVMESLNGLEHPFLVAPDAGSAKKVFKMSRRFEIPMIQCLKSRDTDTGKLSGFQVVSKNLGGRPCVIVDDICDGGGTFIGLAEKLKEKGAGDLYLVVTHGIFSKPLESLKPYFKKIYTTDSWRSDFGWERKERDCTDLVKIIKL